MAKSQKNKVYKVEVFPQATVIEVSAKDLTAAIKAGLEEFAKIHPNIQVAGVNVKEKDKK